MQANLVGKLMGDNPGDSLTKDICLIVDALDGHKYLAKGMSLNHIVHELHSESSAHHDHLLLLRDAPKCWEGCIHETHAESIIQIPQSINKCWIPEII